MSKSPSLSFILLFIIACLIPIGLLSGPFLHWEMLVLILGVSYISYDSLLMYWIWYTAQRAYRQRKVSAELNTVPSITVLIPARNECLSLPKTLSSLLQQDEQPEKIIVVDDGSTDNSLNLLEDNYEIQFADRLGHSRLYPNLQVLSKAHSGKADSLNCGLRLASSDVILTIDADTEVRPGAIRSLRQAFAQHPYLTVVCGIVEPFCPNSLAGRFFRFFQRYEYARSFIWRLAWSQLDSLLLVSGACAAYRRDALVAVGGFNPASWVEDYEVMFRLHDYRWQNGSPCRVLVLPSLRAQTNVPGDLIAFLRQRRRWFGGFIQTMFSYQKIVGNRRYGLLGRVHMVVKTFDMILPIYGLAAILATIFLFTSGAKLSGYVLTVLLLKYGLDILLTLMNIRLYRQWIGLKSQPVTFAGAVVEAFINPLFFQLLRQLSALWGWLAYLRRQTTW